MGFNRVNLHKVLICFLWHTNRAVPVSLNNCTQILLNSSESKWLMCGQRWNFKYNSEKSESWEGYRFKFQCKPYGPRALTLKDFTIYIYFSVHHNILWNNQQMQLYAVNFIPLLSSLYMFRALHTPIIRSKMFNCIYSHWYKP